MKQEPTLKLSGKFMQYKIDRYQVLYKATNTRGKQFICLTSGTYRNKEDFEQNYYKGAEFIKLVEETKEIANV